MKTSQPPTDSLIAGWQHGSRYSADFTRLCDRHDHPLRTCRLSPRRLEQKHHSDSRGWPLLELRRPQQRRLAASTRIPRRARSSS